MKSNFLLIMFFPLLLFSQEAKEHLIFQNAILTTNPAKIDMFEKALADHNKKYHSTDLNGVRVYQIRSGKNTGKYVISSGSTWSAFDKRKVIDGHDEHWKSEFLPNSLPTIDQSFWKFHTDKSHFPMDITVKILMVDMIDVKRGKFKEVMKIVETVSKVLKEKFPEETFGIYTNEFPSSKEGKDIAWVYFFDKASWLSNEMEFGKKYDEMFGEGSFEIILKKWRENTEGSSREIWTFREDLSGISGDIKSSARK